MTRWFFSYPILFHPCTCYPVILQFFLRLGKPAQKVWQVGAVSFGGISHRLASSSIITISSSTHTLPVMRADNTFTSQLLFWSLLHACCLAVLQSRCRTFVESLTFSPRKMWPREVRVERDNGLDWSGVDILFQMLSVEDSIHPDGALSRALASEKTTS